MLIILIIFFSLYEVKIVFKSDQHGFDVKYKSNYRNYQTQRYNQGSFFNFVYFALFKYNCSSFSSCDKYS